VLCQPLPNYDLTLTGQGGSGAVITVTGSLAFDDVACNAPANGAKSVTITNNSNAPKDFTSSFTNGGAWYQITAGQTGTVAANGGTATVTVTPNQVTTQAGAYSGSSTYNDQLKIEITGGPTFNTQITQTAIGADLIATYDKDSTYTSFANNPHTGGSVCVLNIGNVSTDFNASVTDAQWSTLPSPLTLNPGVAGDNPQCQNQRFTPATFLDISDCQKVGTFTSNVTSTAPVCHRDIPLSFSIDGYYCGGGGRLQ
jgi:hypothetical protein